MSTKQRVTVIVVVILVGVVALLWWWRMPSHTAVAVKSKEPAVAVSSLNVSNPAPANAPVPAQPEPPSTQKPSPELRRTLETLNHNDIEFYGRALDQFGEPVPAAEVKGVVIVNTGTRGGEMRRQTTTDGQGYFQFGGFKGQDLGIGISKEGYEYRRRNSSFSYSYFEADHKRHIPDPKKPVVFILWKKQGADALIHYEKEWRFPVNTRPVKIDLLKAKIGEAQTDLTINVSRSPLNMQYGERGFAWKVLIDVEGGGLVHTGETEYYNQAPSSGYKPHLEYAQEAQSVRDAQEGRIKWTWREGVAETFYITSRNGQNYGRLNLEIRPNIDRKEGDNQALVAVKIWLNPNGSRNLEFDPANVIKPTP
jgi:hypothetical protein